MSDYRMTADVITKEIKIWDGDKIVHRCIGYRDAKIWIREQMNRNIKKKKGA